MTPESLKHLIGKGSKPTIYEVTRVDIRKIADAAGDRNPLYWDDDYAAASRYGSLIAPPDFFGWPVNWGPNLPFVFFSESSEMLFKEIFKAGYPRAINGGVESEYFKPVRPGDILSISKEIVSIEEKEGKKGGKMLISIAEMTVINQNGDIVAIQRQTTIH